MKLVKVFVFYHFPTNKLFIIYNYCKIKKTLKKVDNFDTFFNKHSEAHSIKSRPVIDLVIESEKTPPQN